MSMRWSLYPVATYGHGSPQGVRSGHPSIGALLGALTFSQPSDQANRVWLACTQCEAQIEVRLDQHGASSP